jgi:cholesterol oxidase
MAALQVLMSSGSYGEAPTPWRLIGTSLRNISKLPKFYNFRSWSERTLILLVMQSRDNSLVTFRKRGLFGSKLTSRQGHGQAHPAWVPEGHRFAKALAAEIDGTAGAVTTEAFGIPMTAHFLGGATIGASAENGVVDGYLRVFGEPGLHIFDGSALSANPGVNPSLSIAAQAEWACAHWPNLGEVDTRPALGEGFKLISPVAPNKPVVPANAPAAPRLPIRPN